MPLLPPCIYVATTIPILPATHVCRPTSKGASYKSVILLIYIKNNAPSEAIIIEDKSNPEKNITPELKTTEIFKASDLMVDSLTQLLAWERAKNKQD